MNSKTIEQRVREEAERRLRDHLTASATDLIHLASDTLKATNPPQTEARLLAGALRNIADRLDDEASEKGLR